MKCPRFFYSIRYLQHCSLTPFTKFNSDKLLLKIAAVLEKEYGAKSHILRSKRNAGVPVEEAVIREMADHCDVVIAGIGD